MLFEIVIIKRLSHGNARDRRCTRIDVETKRKFVIIVQAGGQILRLAKCDCAENRVEAPPENELRRRVTPNIGCIIGNPIKPAGNQRHLRARPFLPALGIVPLDVEVGGQALPTLSR
jgi:hypothetical protein